MENNLQFLKEKVLLNQNAAFSKEVEEKLKIPSWFVVLLKLS